MRLALAQAEQAAKNGEVPVGAVVVCNGQAVAQAHNQTLGLQDPTAHAEVLALRMAAKALGNHRLEQCSLYVTLEPCSMCSGAVFQARLQRVVYGANEPRMGAAGSVVNLFAQAALNHHTQILGGVLAQRCAALLQDFFAQRRQAKRGAQTHTRLREDALRTAAERFAEAGAPEGRYTHNLPALQGLRMHWLQADSLEQLQPCNVNAPSHWLLCLAPAWHWSAFWQPLLDAVNRTPAAMPLHVLAPDLPGWGRSDKPKKTQWHTQQQHAALLAEFLSAQIAQAAPATRASGVSMSAGQGAPRISLLAADWQWALAIAVAHRLEEMGYHRIQGIWALECAMPLDVWTKERPAPKEVLPDGGQSACTAWVQAWQNLRTPLAWAEHVCKTHQSARQAAHLRGKVDAKPRSHAAPPPASHAAVPQEFVEALPALAQLPGAQDAAWLAAPYPDAGHASALRSAAALLPWRAGPMAAWQAGGHLLAYLQTLLAQGRLHHMPAQAGQYGLTLSSERAAQIWQQYKAVLHRLA